MRKTALWSLLLMALLVVIIPVTSVYAAKKHYDNWQGVAKDMNVQFMQAIDNIEKGDNKAAYKNMNDAYYGYYEVQGFEKYVGYSISAKRVSEIEAMFRDIKHHLLGNKDEKGNKELIAQIRLLSTKVYRDALVLDGVAPGDSPDSIGEAVFGNAQVQKADAGAVKFSSFITSFTLLLREGLEAILVCIAIVTYLIKSGNKQLVKGVYLGMLAGVIGSIFLAILVNWALQGAGQELVEGWTMFLAVAVLFYVSHWMLHRSEEEAWEKYIQSQVARSVDKRNQYILIGAAFLAVIREGAELILFYKAALGGGLTNVAYSVYGFLAAVVVLVVVWVLFRYTTVKLPLRPFFLFTSILLFVLCISFMGKGVKELTEGGVISGATTIPAMNGFTFDWLGIYDRAESIIPQLMLLIASAWIVGSSMMRQRKLKQAKAAAKSEAKAETTEKAEKAE